MSKQDWRDWYIMIHVSAFGASIMAYTFLYHSPAVFCTACGALTTVLGMYHWFTQRDDKIPDAPRGDHDAPVS